MGKLTPKPSEAWMFGFNVISARERERTGHGPTRIDANEVVLIVFRSGKFGPRDFLGDERASNVDLGAAWSQVEAERVAKRNEYARLLYADPPVVFIPNGTSAATFDDVLSAHAGFMGPSYTAADVAAEPVLSPTSGLCLAPSLHGRNVYVVTQRTSSPSSPTPLPPWSPYPFWSYDSFAPTFHDNSIYEGIDPSSQPEWVHPGCGCPEPCLCAPEADGTYWRPDTPTKKDPPMKDVIHELPTAASDTTIPCPWTEATFAGEGARIFQGMGDERAGFVLYTNIAHENVPVGRVLSAVKTHGFGYRKYTWASRADGVIKAGAGMYFGSAEAAMLDAKREWAQMTPRQRLQAAVDAYNSQVKEGWVSGGKMMRMPAPNTPPGLSAKGHEIRVGDWVIPTAPKAAGLGPTQVGGVGKSGMFLLQDRAGEWGACGLVHAFADARGRPFRVGTKVLFRSGGPQVRGVVLSMHPERADVMYIRSYNGGTGFRSPEEVEVVDLDTALLPASSPEPITVGYHGFRVDEAALKERVLKYPHGMLFVERRYENDAEMMVLLPDGRKRRVAGGIWSEKNGFTFGHGLGAQNTDKNTVVESAQKWWNNMSEAQQTRQLAVARSPSQGVSEAAWEDPVARTRLSFIQPNYPNGSVSIYAVLGSVVEDRVGLVGRIVQDAPDAKWRLEMQNHTVEFGHGTSRAEMFDTAAKAWARMPLHERELSIMSYEDAPLFQDPLDAYFPQKERPFTTTRPASAPWPVAPGRQEERVGVDGHKTPSHDAPDEVPLERRKAQWCEEAVRQAWPLRTPQITVTSDRIHKDGLDLLLVFSAGGWSMTRGLPCRLDQSPGAVVAAIRNEAVRSYEDWMLSEWRSGKR